MHPPTHIYILTHLLLPTYTYTTGISPRAPAKRARPCTVPRKRKAARTSTRQEERGHFPHDNKMSTYKVEAIEVLKGKPREAEAKDIITRVAKQVREGREEGRDREKGWTNRFKAR